MVATKRWPSDAPYVAGKFREVVDALATGHDAIIERMRNVCQSHLHVIRDTDFPDTLLPEWKDIHTHLTAVEPTGPDDQRGSFNRTLDEMSEEDAADLAQRLCDLARKYKDAIPPKR